ncbi:class I SAM-dependent methyltransferase [Hyphomonas sp.]|uniref:class I SAM-dependent methyltransferase n=1 Tax=Alphaproteobacteria TaxID=28211 RepID=UPI0032635220
MGVEHAAAYLNGQFNGVKGWCGPHLWNVIQPLHEYQQAAGVKGPIAEIGVFHGKFFIGLALTKKGEGIHTAFDVFDMQRFNLDGAGKGDLQTFQNNLKEAGFGEEAIDIRKVDSMALTRHEIEHIREERGQFSMFSVDGCHMTEHTVNDFRIAMELTQPGGIIYVDDYLNADWPGVQEGLARLYLNDCPQFVPVAYASNKLFTCHISFAADVFKHLRDNVKESFPRCQVKTVRRFGYECLNVRPDLSGPFVRESLDFDAVS